MISQSIEVDAFKGAGDGAQWSSAHLAGDAALGLILSPTETRTKQMLQPHPQTKMGLPPSLLYPQTHIVKEEDRLTNVTHARTLSQANVIKKKKIRSATSQRYV